MERVLVGLQLVSSVEDSRVQADTVILNRSKEGFG